MSNFESNPEQHIFALPEHEAKLHYMAMHDVRGPLEDLTRIIRERAEIAEDERNKLIGKYVDVGFAKMQAWADKADRAVLGTEFADRVENELERVTEYLPKGDTLQEEDNLHWMVKEYYGDALSEDVQVGREDDWPKYRFPLKEALAHIDTYGAQPSDDSSLSPQRYDEQLDRWDNWYADGIDPGELEGSEQEE